MATDGPTPAPCDAEVFERGKCVLVTAGVSSNRMERWVREVARYSEQKVDWHFSGGRAVVLGVGDQRRIDRAIRDLTPMLDDLRRETETDERC
jgi:hypothetical protein